MDLVTLLTPFFFETRNARGVRNGTGWLGNWCDRKMRWTRVKHGGHRWNIWSSSGETLSNLMVWGVRPLEDLLMILSQAMRDRKKSLEKTTYTFLIVDCSTSARGLTRIIIEYREAGHVNLIKQAINQLNISLFDSIFGKSWTSWKTPLGKKLTTPWQAIYLECALEVVFSVGMFLGVPKIGT